MPTVAWSVSAIVKTLDKIITAFIRKKRLSLQITQSAIRGNNTNGLSFDRPVRTF